MPVEIACDESGFTGGNLTFREAVFTHASVLMSIDVAAEEMQRLRRRVAAHGELKASWLLRWCDHEDLRRLLDPTETLRDGARLLVVDTRLFLLRRLCDVTGGEALVRGLDLPGGSEAARGNALLLRRDGESALGSRWQDLLTLAGNALRPASRWVPVTAVDEFDVALDQVLAELPSGPIRDRLHEIRCGTDRLRAARQELDADPRRTPLMEPLLPVLAQATLAWSQLHQDLLVIHDEQSALTRSRVAEMAMLLTTRFPGHVVDVERVDSKNDPRVQIADLLAGIGRRAATSLLGDRPDPRLLSLVRPLVDPTSIWPDDEWSAAPESGRRALIRTRPASSE